MTIVSILAFGLHALSGLNIGISFVMVIGAMLVNGYIATVEDDWPGGFNNPNPGHSETEDRVAKITERFLRTVLGNKKKP